jgi:hypothetical protein
MNGANVLANIKRLIPKFSNVGFFDHSSHINGFEVKISVRWKALHGLKSGRKIKWKGFLFTLRNLIDLEINNLEILIILWLIINAICIFLTRIMMHAHNK